MPHTVLSVRQPWAGLLVAGTKRFEVRTWRPPTGNGWFLIHASSSKAAGMPELRADSDLQRALGKAQMHDEEGWPRNAIIGAVRLARVLDLCYDELPSRLSRIDAAMIGDYPDRYLWQMDRSQTFIQPIVTLGKLNLWRPDARLSRCMDARIHQDMPEYRPWSRSAT